MNRWKKYVAVLTSAAILAGVISGCGSSGSGTEAESNTTANDTITESEVQDTADTAVANTEMATVSVHMPQALNYTEEGIAAVENEMNRIMGERYGVQVDLNYIDLGNWTTQTNLALTTDECDIITLLTTPLMTFINNGQLTPLSSYYDNSSAELKATFSKEELDSTSYNGELYSLPRKYWGGNEQVLNMSKKIIDEMGIDVSAINSLEAVDKLLYQVKEAYPDIHVLVPGTGNKLIETWYFGDGMSDERGRFGMVPFFDSDFDENNINVKSVFETEAFKEIADYAYKWYQDGLILTDVLSNTIDGETYIRNEQAFAFFGVYCGNGYVALDNNNPSVPSANLGPSMSYSYSYTSISWGISSNSKQPAEAWKVLEAIYADKEIATLFMEGIEGEDYVYKDDGTITLPEGVDTSNCRYGGMYQYWAYPNTILPVPSDLVGANYAENVEAYNAALEHSPIVGFKWDSSECADEMTAVSNIYDQYFHAILSGIVNPEETIPQVVEELNQAGMEKILESQKEQLNQFVQTK